MTSTGFVQFKGSVHDGGLTAVKYNVLSVFPNAVSDAQFGFQPLILEHLGEISDTFGFGSRDDSWDESTTDDTIASNWRTVKQSVGASTTELYTDVDLFEGAEAATAAATGAFLLHL